jgi:hypothetical protein
VVAALEHRERFSRRPFSGEQPAVGRHRRHAEPANVGASEDRMASVRNTANTRTFWPANAPPGR